METRETHPAKLLIIDDEAQIRRLLCDLFCGVYDCSEASSAEEALTALSEQTFDLVLSDIDMGRMSGLELVPRIHALSPDTVVVMISGNQDIEFAIRAMRAGAFDYITKPIDLRHVEAAVERALNHGAVLQERRRYKEEI
jgi:two-component system response regulator FlrC